MKTYGVTIKWNVASTKESGVYQRQVQEDSAHLAYDYAFVDLVSELDRKGKFVIHHIEVEQV